jgi:hypothetical protein
MVRHLPPSCAPSLRSSDRVFGLGIGIINEDCPSSARTPHGCYNFEREGLSIKQALRAVLKKAGCADVRFELRRDSAFDFTIIEDDKPVAVFWRTISPRQAMTGDPPTFMGIQEAWQSCLAKRFPGYAATNLEESFSE